MTPTEFLRRADHLSADYPADFRRLVHEAAFNLRAILQRGVPQFHMSFNTHGLPGENSFDFNKRFKRAEAEHRAAAEKRSREAAAKFVQETLAWIEDWTDDFKTSAAADEKLADAWRIEQRRDALRDQADDEADYRRLCREAGISPV